MRKQLWWVISGSLIIALAFGAWQIWGTPKGPLKVKAGVVAPISMQEEVYATGSVVPASRQEVRVTAPGIVSEVAVKVGESVKAGQTLVTLDTTLADAQVAQSKANVEAAQTSVNAAQSSLEELQKAQSQSAVGAANLSSVSSVNSAALSTLQGTEAMSGTEANSAVSVSPSALRQTEGALAQSKAALKQSQEMLKVAQVQQGQLIHKARIAGTVLEVNAEPGNLSSMQSPLVVVADVSQMNVEAQLNEVDAGKVKAGEKVSITSKILGDNPVQGTLVEVAPAALTEPSIQGNSSPTVGIKVRLDQVPAVLKPGFTVSIKLIVANKVGILAVPQEALFQEGNKNYVYRIQAGRLHKTEVKLGIGNDTHQEITAGLNSGDQVVVNPSNDLSEGMTVAPEVGSGGA